MALTDKQIRFGNEYVIDFNATKAYKRAGYSVKSDAAAAVEAHKLLRNPKIQEYITSLKHEAKQNNQLTAQMVIDELAKIAFHNVQDFVNGGNSILELKYIDREKTAAVSGIKTTSKTVSSKVNGQTKTELEIQTDLKFHSKDKALELLGRHFGIFEKDNEQGKLKLEVALTKEQIKEIDETLEKSV